MPTTPSWQVSDERLARELAMRRRCPCTLCRRVLPYLEDLFVARQLLCKETVCEGSHSSSASCPVGMT